MNSPCSFLLQICEQKESFIIDWLGPLMINPFELVEKNTQIFLFKFGMCVYSNFGYFYIFQNYFPALQSAFLEKEGKILTFLEFWDLKTHLTGGKLFWNSKCEAIIFQIRKKLYNLEVVREKFEDDPRPVSSESIQIDKLQYITNSFI